MGKINRSLLLICFLFAGVCTSQIAPREPENVAIFLYQDVELLDFAGPGEVFAAAGFNTYTVSVDGKSLVSQRFVTIQPEYSIDNAPTPDIIIFPGGASGASSNDPKVMAWIKELRGAGSDFMSVCTGAFILAKAGLLENKRATTHHGSVKTLAEQYPSTTVLEDTRWVDNDDIITTAGVSAGIDGALHLVSRLNGLEKARTVAHYMEYDKWDPDKGVVDKRNEYLESLLTVTVKGAQSGTSFRSTLPVNVTAPYLGEFKNLGSELLANGEYAKAARILEAGTTLYPDSGLLYADLGEAYKKLGNPTPISESQFIQMVHDGKVDEAITRFEQDKKSFPTWKIFSENGLKNEAYYLLLDKKDFEGAIKAFELNAKEYPKSPDTFDSLGEAYLAAGKRKEGIKSYGKAAAMGYPNAIKVLNDLGVR